MCFGTIRAKWRAWRVKVRSAKRIKLRSVDEIIDKYKASVRAQMKAGREENWKDSNYYSGASDILRWIMKEETNGR